MRAYVSEVMYRCRQSYERRLERSWVAFVPRSRQPLHITASCIEFEADDAPETRALMVYIRHRDVYVRACLHCSEDEESREERGGEATGNACQALLTLLQAQTMGIAPRCFPCATTLLTHLTKMD